MATRNWKKYKNLKLDYDLMKLWIKDNNIRVKIRKHNDDIYIKVKNKKREYSFFEDMWITEFPKNSIVISVSKMHEKLYSIIEDAYKGFLGDYIWKDARSNDGWKIFFKENIPECYDLKSCKVDMKHWVEKEEWVNNSTVNIFDNVFVFEFNEPKNAIQFKLIWGGDL